MRSVLDELANLILVAAIGFILAFPTMSAYGFIRAGFSTQASGWLQPATAAGATIIYVSATGSDSNTCTSSPPIDPNFATPCLTSTHAVSLANALGTTGTANNILFKRGGVFTHQVIGCSYSGISPTQPFVIGAYGPVGAKPVFKLTPADGAFIQTQGGGCSRGDNLVVSGIELYAYTRDPGGSPNASDIQSTGFSGLAFLWPANYILVEDVTISYFNDNLNFAGGSYGPNILVNRNNIHHGYVAHTPWRGQGLFVDGAVPGPIVTENIFYKNGWNDVLAAPQTCTITIAAPAVVTCTGNFFVNTSTIVFSTTGALPTGIVAGTQYCVANLSGATFNIIPTDGANGCDGVGSNITTTGTQSGTQSVSWYDASAATGQSHNAYLQYTNGCTTFTGNISSYAGATGVQHRAGGNNNNNFYDHNAVGIEFGTDCSGVNSVTLNVIQGMTDLLTPPLSASANGRGEGIDACNHSTGNIGAAITHNVINGYVQTSSLAGNSFGVTLEASSGNCGSSIAGMVVTNNSICSLGAANFVVDNGTGNTTAPQTGTKQADCTGLGFSNPTYDIGSYDASIGGLGTAAHFYSQAVGTSGSGNGCSRFGSPAWSSAQCSGNSVRPAIGVNYGQ